MLVALSVAAIAAIAVGIATTSVVMLTRQDNNDKSEELARYKATAELRIAEAAREAAEARLALARFKEPRFIDSHLGAPFVKALEKFRGTRVDVMIDLDAAAPDAREISFHIVMAFSAAGCIVKDWIGWGLQSQVNATGISVWHRYEAGSTTLRDAAQEIADAFRLVGIHATANTAFDGDGLSGAFVSLPGANVWNTNDVAPIRIIIGRKP